MSKKERERNVDGTCRVEGPLDESLQRNYYLVRGPCTFLLTPLDPLPHTPFWLSRRPDLVYLPVETLLITGVCGLLVKS